MSKVSGTDDTNKIVSLLRFKHSLQVLSISAEEQLTLYPDFVVKADELALDFSHWYEVVTGNYKADFKQNQLEALLKLDALLDTMSGKANSNLWTEEAVRNDPHWDAIRELAKEALDSFSWESKVPEDFVQNIYISAKPK